MTVINPTPAVPVHLKHGDDISIVISFRANGAPVDKTLSTMTASRWPTTDMSGSGTAMTLDSADAVNGNFVLSGFNVLDVGLHYANFVETVSGSSHTKFESQIRVSTTFGSGNGSLEAQAENIILQDGTNTIVINELGAQVSGGGGGGGASQLSDLSDVSSSTKTNRYVLVADGANFVSRALVEADISDLQAYALAGSLAAVATSGNYDDLSNKPDLSVYDEVEQHANLGAFPGTGDNTKFYLAQDTGLMYRWTGSAYQVISAQLALGETSSTAYRGDRGKTAYDHSQLISGNPHGVTASDIGVEPAATADQTDSEIEAAYNNQVPQVSGAEITAGTEPGIRRYSPADVKSFVDQHAGPGGGDAWSDPVDANIVPDTANTRTAGSEANPFDVIISRSYRVNGGIVFAERADHFHTPTAGRGEFWMKDSDPPVLMYTDEAGTDFQLNLTAAEMQALVLNAGLPLNTNPNRATNWLAQYNPDLVQYERVLHLDITSKQPKRPIAVDNYTPDYDDRGHLLLVDHVNPTDIFFDDFANMTTAYVPNIIIAIQSRTTNAVTISKHANVTLNYDDTLYQLETAGKLAPYIICRVHDTNVIDITGGLKLL